MAKDALEEAQKLANDFGGDLVAVCNQAHKALKKVPPGEELLGALARAEAKLLQYQTTLQTVGEVRAKQLKASYEDDVDTLTELVKGLQEKQAKG